MGPVRRSNRTLTRKSYAYSHADESNADRAASLAAEDPADTDAGSAGDDEEDVAKKPSSRHLRNELNALHQEMEIVQYGTTSTGHKRRKLRRPQLKARTRKRKLLEKEDDHLFAEETGVAPRLRGSKAAEKDEVLHGSLVFGAKQGRAESSDQRDDNGNEDEAGFEDVEGEEEVEEDEFSVVEDDEEEVGAADREEDDDEHVDYDDEETARQSTAKRKKPKSLSAPRASKKRLFRMRNFTSQRLARRHGEALGAHARGQPKRAIQMLKQVAKEVPSAPQVYSSLGMVYEDMLREVQWTGGPDEEDSLQEEIELAKKAYGSYHVAAILCRKDYTLWVRAADVAKEIADLHTSMMLLPDISDNDREFNRSEKQRWLTEAKNDYQTADNLHPPGIDVPAKLAELLIALGHLSEALTLLTDLKNRAVSTGASGSDFESSYRAWLLYSGLMLRVGYECKKWNSGDHSNTSYMFRRWLRKFSLSFDWQERRLQALAKALEAAAGSKSCKFLMVWIEARVHSKVGAKENGSLSSSGNDRPNVGNSGGADLTTGSSFTKTEFQREKEVLLEKNRAELAAFDMTTTEMSLNDPEAGAARSSAREAIVLDHKAAVIDLVGGYHEKSRAETRVSEPESGRTGAVARPVLPIAASSVTVFGIARELLRHMIDLRLHTGGRLVGEAVSLYLKERASLLEKRLDSRQKYLASQVKPTSMFALHHETYDSGESTSEEEDQPLSDDDDLVSRESSNTLDSLRSGVLPPELRVMYGLCLAGEGSKQFLALKCLEAANGLALETHAWLKELRIDTGVVVDSGWIDFQADMTESLGRISAYAMIASFLRDGKLNLDDGNMSTRFSILVDKLTETGIVDEALNGKATHTTALRRKDIVLGVLLASARYQSLVAERTVKAADKELEWRGQDMIVGILDSLSRYLSLSWIVQSDGSIPSSCTEILSLMASTVNLLSSFDGGFDEEFLQKLVDNLGGVVSLVCDIPALNLRAGDQNSLNEFATIPIQDSWLTDDLKLLALRTLNCLVATNVSHFSGWEKKEFSMALLSDTDLPYYFGISQSEEKIAGIIDASHEETLGTLWRVVENIIPGGLQFDFALEASKLKSTKAYIEREERHQATLRVQNISRFAEEHCLAILLCFSRCCLQLAQKLQTRRARLVHGAMAVLLPVTEFFVNQPLWRSNLGQSALSRVGSTGWRPPSATQETGGAARVPVRRAPKKRSAPASSSMRRNFHQWFAGESEEKPVSNVIPIPPEALLARWNSISCSQERPEADHETMQKLDESVRRLRFCYSERAAEKASLSVAVRLVELAENPLCQNPFLCLQQATLFASRGAKGGTSDDLFKKPLPNMEDCNAFEAIGVLGRADCLQAVYFYPEAAFLISYVASVCALHRDPSRTDISWNSQWMSLALLTYNQSVLLRASANNIVKEHGRKEDTAGTWEPHVLSELKCARSDGLSWLESARAQQIVLGTNGRSTHQDATMDEATMETELSIDIPAVEDKEDPLTDVVEV